VPKSSLSSLQPIFEECREWLAYPQHQVLFEDERTQLQAYLAASGQLNPKALLSLKWLAHHSGMAACEAYGRQDLPVLASHLNSSVDYRALVLRLEAAFSAMTPETTGGGRPAPFKDSVNAAAPAMLGRWDVAQICANGFIEIAEKDQRLRIPGSRRLRHGTLDAFLVSLFSQAFLIETVFQSIKSIHPVYAALLQYWGSPNPTDFVPAMQEATEFHVSRSRDSSDSVEYEFDSSFTRVFPVELLMVQSLRRRDNLPAIEIGHPLVDDAWSTITQLPSVPADSLLVAVEARLKKDYPLFRSFDNCW
jgi:hypothetical protein